MPRLVVFNRSPPLATDLDGSISMNKLKEKNVDDLLGEQSQNSMDLIEKTFDNNDMNMTNNETKSQWLVLESSHPPSTTPIKNVDVPVVDSLLRSTTSKWRTVDKLNLIDKNSGNDEKEFEIAPTQMNTFADSHGMTDTELSTQSQVRATQKFDLIQALLSPEQGLKVSFDDNQIILPHSQEACSNPFLVTTNFITEQKHVQFDLIDEGEYHVNEVVHDQNYTPMIQNNITLDSSRKSSKKTFIKHDNIDAANDNSIQAKTQMLLQADLPRRSPRTIEKQSQKGTLNNQSIKASTNVKLADPASHLRLSNIAPQSMFINKDIKNETPSRGTQFNTTNDAKLSDSKKSGRKMRKTTSAETDFIESQSLTDHERKGKRKIQVKTRHSNESPTKNVDCSPQFTIALLPNTLVWIPFIKDGIATNFYCLAQLIKRVSMRREKWKLRALSAEKKRGNEFVDKDEAIVSVENMCTFGIGLERGDTVYRKGNKDVTAGIFMSWIQKKTDDGQMTLVRMKESALGGMVTVKLKRLLIDKQLFLLKKTKTLNI